MKIHIPLLLAISAALTSCDKPSDDQNTAVSVEEAAEMFPHKKLTFWDKDASYTIHLYGDMAYICRSEENAPKYLYPVDTERFMSIWSDFHALPEIGNYKNLDPSITKSRDSHIVVFLNNAAGLEIGSGGLSYSIPRDVSSDAYIEWGESVKGVIAEYLSEQAAASDR